MRSMAPPVVQVRLSRLRGTEMARSSSTTRELRMVAMVVAILAVITQVTPAQQEKDTTIRTIYACAIKSTAPGAEFRFGFSYWVTADASGKPVKITPFESKMRSTAIKFIDEKSFVDCMKKWTLESHGKYIVQFNVGTMSSGSSSEPYNYVMILGPGESGQKLKLALSWSAEQTLIVPKAPAKH
jgi:hypothetical protein